MADKNVESLLKLVEERTGYPVSISTQKNLPTHSSMIMARKDSPAHVIFLNPAHESVGNYLIVLQCRMVLMKWAGDRLFDFVPQPENISPVIQEVISHARKTGMPGDRAKALAQMIVTGLLQQLNSMPTQMLAADWCFAECPSLRAEQNKSMMGEMRDFSRSLSTEIRKMTPASIFDRNASMNAAYTVWWSRLSGEQQALLPYKALGFLEKGEALFAAYTQAKAGDEPQYCRVVDAWAGVLGMSQWYQWNPRDK